jgi:hypothetical protein
VQAQRDCRQEGRDSKVESGTVRHQFSEGPKKNERRRQHEMVGSMTLSIADDFLMARNAVCVLSLF